MKCDHSRSNLTLTLCNVPGDRQPTNGWQFPRCVQCGHRVQYEGSKPQSTRRIMLTHPFYIVTELRNREKAKRCGRAGD